MSLLEPHEIDSARGVIDSIEQSLARVVFDQPRVLELVTTAILARGHVLLEGLPGLGKTELCKALARLLGLPFKRIQFTPDLLPGDVTGTYVLEGEARRELVFRPGPLFASLVLADEINRAPPKTQAALLEAMQERTVTVLGHTHPLPSPFFVVATQNPIELEGTYPLPEAQLDRFMFRVTVPGVRAKTLAAIVRERPQGASPVLAPVPPDTLAGLSALADRVHLPAAVADYIARLVEATHAEIEGTPEASRRFIRFGASPRAALALAASGRALALARGRPNVSFDDVRDAAEPALAHRLVLTHDALLERVSARDVVGQLLAAVPEAPRA